MSSDDAPVMPAIPRIREGRVSDWFDTKRLCVNSNTFEDPLAAQLQLAEWHALFSSSGANKPHRFWVAEHQNNLVGMIATSDQADQSVKLHWLRVLPAWIGSPVPMLLIYHALCQCQADQRKKVRLAEDVAIYSMLELLREAQSLSEEHSQQNSEGQSQIQSHPPANSGLPEDWSQQLMGLLNDNYKH